MENGDVVAGIIGILVVIIIITIAIINDRKEKESKRIWDAKPEYTIKKYAGGYYTICYKGSDYYWSYSGEIRSIINDKLSCNCKSQNDDSVLRFDTEQSAREAIGKHYAAVDADKVIDNIPYFRDGSQDRRRGSEILDLLDESVSDEREIQLIKELREIY